jgi:uncharacterized protein (DUF1697 family)
MTIYVALLRGINVGGNKLIKMAELRELFELIGLHNVKTYIQSGNVLFKTDKESPKQLRQRIEQEIHFRFGFPVTVVLRTANKFEQIIKECPYSVDTLLDGESLHVALLSEKPSQEKLDLLLSLKSDKDECHIEDKEIYLYLRQSIRHSKLAIQLQKLGVPATVRNWKTMNKLVSMVNEMN